MITFIQIHLLFLHFVSFIILSQSVCIYIFICVCGGVGVCTRISEAFESAFLPPQHFSVNFLRTRSFFLPKFSYQGQVHWYTPVTYSTVVFKYQAFFFFFTLLSLTQHPIEDHRFNFCILSL